MPIMIKKLVTACLLVFAGLSVAVADDIKQFQNKVQDNLTRVNPDYKVRSVEPSRLAGFYNVQLENGPLIYVTEDAGYFFAGELYQIADERVVNVTEQDAARARAGLVKEFNIDEMIIFSPKAPIQTKTHITVYTDVDCFYCQKIHQEVPELNAMGIEVRYVAYPRAGIGSESYKRIVSAWCADDQQTALTKLKNRERIPMVDCDNPVTKQFDLGKRMGISGTPAIILEDGGMIPGYRPARDLARMLGI